MAPSKPKPSKSKPSKPKNTSKSRSSSKATPTAAVHPADQLKQDALGNQRNGGPKNNLEAELQKLRAENQALRMAAAAKENVGTLIPRPVKGASRNGFKLQAAMGLEDDDNLYTAIRRAIKDAVLKTGIDYTIPWPRQSKLSIAKVIAAARERHSYLNRFEHGWPVEEFLKVSMKNKRAYTRRTGFAESSCNGDDEGSNEDECNPADEDNTNESVTPEDLYMDDAE